MKKEQEKKKKPTCGPRDNVSWAPLLFSSSSSLSRPHCPVIVLSSSCRHPLLVLSLLSHPHPLLVVPSSSSPCHPVLVLVSSSSHPRHLILILSLLSRHPCHLVLVPSSLSRHPHCLILILSSSSCCPHSPSLSSCRVPSCCHSPIAMSPSPCCCHWGQVLGTGYLRCLSLSSRRAPLIIPPSFPYRLCSPCPPHPHCWPVVGLSSSSSSSSLAASTCVPPHEQGLTVVVRGAVLFIVVPSLSSRSRWLLAAVFHPASRCSQGWGVGAWSWCPCLVLVLVFVILPSSASPCCSSFFAGLLLSLFSSSSTCLSPSSWSSGSLLSTLQAEACSSGITGWCLHLGSIVKISVVPKSEIKLVSQ